MPIPWNSRATISQVMSVAKPAATDEQMKITSAVWNSSLRPHTSESLPHTGVDAVMVSRVALATHDSRSWPPSSPTIVGRAVPTIDVVSIDVSIASIRPTRISIIWRRE